ncbi:6-phosphogluconolactonase-like [Convolutriloba macropyga]|uniref:6-phosphogluconolactonase-like n=1 Tax=Convolutriloba macropyga TaxID=536237 RepID=UPI003F526FF6
MVKYNAATLFVVFVSLLIYCLLKVCRYSDVTMEALQSKGNVKHVKCSSSGEVGALLKDKILEIGVRELQSTQSFVFGLSGGSMIKLLADLPKVFDDNSVLKSGLEQKNVQIFFCDERKVEYDNDESTYGAYMNYWKDTPLASAVIPINPVLPLEDCAVDYDEKLVSAVGASTKLDLVLLGIGPDGHTCSLFPNHPLLKETRLGVVPISDSPKPPPQRVTLTLPTVRAASMKIVFATGSGKQPIVKRVLVDGEVSEDIPVSLVSKHEQGIDDSVLWIVDADSSRDCGL